MDTQREDIKLKDIFALAADMIEQSNASIEKRLAKLEETIREQQYIIAELEKRLHFQEGMVDELEQRNALQNINSQLERGEVEPDGSIPDDMAGLGILGYGEELAEKANEAAPGSDVFELMERQNEVEDEPEMKDEIEVKDEPEVEDDVDDETVIDDDEIEIELEEEGTMILNEAVRPDWYDWEVDYPASYVDDVYRAISFNDRYEFIKELFNISGDLSEAEVLFKDTLDDINEMENFKQVVGYIRHRFPQWDEQSDEVYRFYMAIRRKFNRE